MDASANSLSRYAYSDSWQKSQDTRQAKWEAFCALDRPGLPMRWPPDLAAFRRFVAWLCTRAKKGEPMALSSVRSYSAYVQRRISEDFPLAPDLVNHPSVQLIYRGAASVLGAEVTKARPCTLHDLLRAAVVVEADPTSQNVTAMTLGVIGLFGALRTASLVPPSAAAVQRELFMGHEAVRDPRDKYLPLRRGDVTFASDLSFAQLSLRRSKTDRDGSRHHEIRLTRLNGTFAKVCPVAWLLRWCSTVRPGSDA